MGTDRKAVTAGTHRACPPEETWARVEPLLAAVGVTRVADITWLDDIGVPVFQATAPRSRSLATAQGKGLTPMLARVSAVMEAIEAFAAEAPPISRRNVTADEVGIDYDVGLRATPGYGYLARTARLDWCTAVDLQCGRQTYVPAPLVSLDWTVRRRWEPLVFASSSDGLASGNTYAEAALHGLLELLERAATAVPSRVGVDPASVVTGEAGHLVRRLRDLGLAPQIAYHPGALGLPAFSVRLVDDSYPVAFLGYGCHLDADVALCRALTESVQSRATHISGSRDDMVEDSYRASPRPLPRDAGPLVAIDDVVDSWPIAPTEEIVADLDALLALMRPQHPHVLAVDLTLVPGVHVVKVVVPTLPVPEGH